MTRDYSRGTPRGWASFTLVEVLVSVALLSIFIIILCSMLGSLLTAWQLGQAHNERRTAAQIVFNRLSADLSQAALPGAMGATNSLELVINPGGVSPAYKYPQAMFWQAPVATDGGVDGNLAIVGYFVQWVNGSPASPCLSRVLINPSSPDYGIYSGNPSPWISTALLQKYAPAAYVSATSTNNYTGLLAANVLGFWVQALDPSGNPIQQANSTNSGESYDSKYPYSYTNSIDPASNPATNVASALPASFQVAIAIVDSRTAAKLAAIPSGYTTTGNFWADIQNFYTSLPPVIRKGTEIQSITIGLAHGPR